MSLLTTWGYTLADADALPPLLTLSEFNALTANKYAGDARIEPNINAASMAVRNYCGWHIWPALACALSERQLLGNGRVKRAGPDLLIQLPAKYITAIVTEKGIVRPPFAENLKRIKEDADK